MPFNRRAPPSLPPGAQRPVVPVSPYPFPMPHTSPTPSHSTYSQPWSSEYRFPLPQPPLPPSPPSVPHISRPRVLSMQGPSQPRPRSEGDQHGSFGIANVHRSASHLQNAPRHSHQNLSTDRAPLRLDPNYLQPNANFSTTSFASYNSNDYGNEVIHIYTLQDVATDTNCPRDTTTILLLASLTCCSFFLWYTFLVISFSWSVIQTSIRRRPKAVPSRCATRSRPRMASLGPSRGAGRFGKARGPTTIRHFRGREIGKGLRY